MGIKIALRHNFGDFAVDADFEAPAGVTVLYGPSGSGKSTILNAVTGLLSPQSAWVEVGGTVLADTARRISLPPHKRRLGVIFQEGRLFPHLTVRQNLRYGRFFSRQRGSGVSEDAIVDILGIGAFLDRLPARLSGGEQQRVAIGRALLSNPAMLVADEPLSALDDDRKAEILPYFELLRDQLGISILYVTHSSAEVARLATTMVSLREGKVVAVGPPAEVLSGPAMMQKGRDAAALLMGNIAAHHPDGITEIRAGEATLFIPLVEGAIGSDVRLRIASQDVMLAKGRPAGLSALNQLAGVIEDMHDEGNSLLIKLSTPAGDIISRVTKRSAQCLGVSESMRCTAIIKSMSLTY